MSDNELSNQICTEEEALDVDVAEMIKQEIATQIKERMPLWIAEISSRITAATVPELNQQQAAELVQTAALQDSILDT